MTVALERARSCAATTAGKKRGRLCTLSGDHNPQHAVKIFASQLRVGAWTHQLSSGASRWRSRKCLPFVVEAPGVLTTVPAQARPTSTWDQDSETARHDLLADLFAEGIYFTHPGSPWMRATNENTNGLLRQYFPTTTDLPLHSVDDLRQAK